MKARRTRLSDAHAARHNPLIVGWNVFVRSTNSMASLTNLPLSIRVAGHRTRIVHQLRPPGHFIQESLQSLDRWSLRERACGPGHARVAGFE